MSSRDIGKDKDKCDGGEDEDGKEQSTPRGRKTANSQGRRKGRITTRSMANEAASVAAEEPPPPEPLLPSEPPQPSKPEPTTQKAVREPTKSAPGEPPMDPNRGGKHLSYSMLLVAHYHPLEEEEKCLPRCIKKNRLLCLLRWFTSFVVMLYL